MSERVRGIALNTLNLTSSDSTTIASNNTGQRKYILGVFVSTVSGGTLALADAAKTIAATFTPVAATWYPMPVVIDGALSITIGASVNCTVFYGGE